jgi:hypothetical protein
MRRAVSPVDDAAEVADELLALARRWESESHPDHRHTARLCAAELRDLCDRLGLLSRRLR